MVGIDERLSDADVINWPHRQAAFNGQACGWHLPPLASHSFEEVSCWGTPLRRTVASAKSPAKNPHRRGGEHEVAAGVGEGVRRENRAETGATIPRASPAI